MPFLCLTKESAVPKNSKILAVVRSGTSLDGNVLALSSKDADDETAAEQRAKATLKFETFERALRKAKLKPQEASRAFTLLTRQVKAGDDEEEVPEPLRPVFRSMLAACAAPEHANAVCLPPGHRFELVPTQDAKGRNCLGFFGAAGCGKTWACANWVLRYHKLWPDRKIFILSANTVSDDPAWLSLPESARPKQLDANTLMESGIDVARDFGKPCCVVVDDLLDAVDGRMKRAVVRFVSDLLDIGRRHGVSCCITNHLLTDGQRTRALLHSLEAVYIFPSLTPSHSTRYFCKKIGIPETMIPWMKSAGRAVVCSIVAPQYLLGDSECRLIE
jgi:hypothetical protein